MSTPVELLKAFEPRLDAAEKIVLNEIRSFLMNPTSSPRQKTRVLFEAKFAPSNGQPDELKSRYEEIAQLLRDCRAKCEKKTGGQVECHSLNNTANEFQELITMAEQIGDQTVPSEEFFSVQKRRIPSNNPKPIPPSEYVFNRRRVELLFRAWAVSYFCGLRHDRLLDAALREVETIGALPAGITQVISSGNILEETRHRISVLKWTPSSGNTGLLVVSDTPLAVQETHCISMEDAYAKQAIAEFYYCLQLWLFSNALTYQRDRHNLKLSAYYYARGQTKSEATSDHLAFAPGITLISRDDALSDEELDQQRTMIPPGVYGDDAGIQHFSYNQPKWHPEGKDYEYPYSARFVTPREIIQYVSFFESSQLPGKPATPLEIEAESGESESTPAPPNDPSQGE